ncbi:MAG: type II secretion system F family protein [Phycisphaerales bacterium]|nr:MAG: type II secretion system F family protein [Phycisphaerales bacterium]
MSKWRYDGYDMSGARVRGLAEGESKSEAEAKLRDQGVFVTQLRETSTDAEDRAPRTMGTPQVRTGDPRRTAGFLKQMALLVNAGTPLADALAAVERQCADIKLKPTLTDIRRRVEEGASFSESLAAHPRRFDAVVCTLIEAGENGADMRDILVRVSAMIDRQAQLRAAMVGAMIYPLTLVTVCLAVLVMVIVVVLPRFGELFGSLSVPLPASTQVLLDMSAFLQAYWWGVSLALIVSVGSAAWWLRTPSGRRWTDMAVVRAPRFGPINQAFMTAKVARVLGLLVENRVPLSDALSLVRSAAGNTLYTELVARVEEAVERGEPMNRVMIESELMPPSFCELVQTGEESGRLGEVLTSAADFMEIENEALAKQMTKMLEPMILTVMGLLVGGVAISMFLPLFDLTASAGGGP